MRPTLRQRDPSRRRFPAGRVVCIALGLAFGTTAAAAREWKTARIATDGATPLFNALDAARQPQGFEIDVVRAACERAGIRCDFVQIETDGLAAALNGKKVDAVAAFLPANDETKARYDLSDKYYTPTYNFLAPRTLRVRNTTPDGLKGRSIGVRSGIAAAKYLIDTYRPKGARIVPVATSEALFDDLAAGRLDAIFLDPVPVFKLMSRPEIGKCCEVIGTDIRDGKLIGDGIALGLRKSDADLKVQFNKGLSDMMRDGTYEKIGRKYFPFAVY